MPAQQPTAIQDHYPDDFATCYGCGRLNSAGLHVRSIWEGDGAVARFVPLAEHMGVPGFVYGGLLASLVDCHGVGTAAAAAERAEGREVGAGPAPRYVTASLKVEFLAPTPLGPVLELRAHVMQSGARKAVVAVTVTVAGALTARGEVVAVRIPVSMGGA